MQQPLLNLEGRGLVGALAYMWGHFLGVAAYLPPLGGSNFIGMMLKYLKPAKISAAVASR